MPNMLDHYFTHPGNFCFIHRRICWTCQHLLALSEHVIRLGELHYWLSVQLVSQLWPHLSQ